MVGILSLPTELRHLIFHYCNLVVDGEIIPYPASHHLRTTKFGVTGGCQVSRKPDVALLAVNRQIRRETSPILYGHNAWRLTSPLQPISGVGHDVFRIQPRLFRHIKIEFGLADITWDFLRDAGASARHDYGGVASVELRTHMISDRVHRECISQLQAQWQYCFFLLLAMDLETLECDMSSCSCVTGCCRLACMIPWVMLTAQGRNLNTDIVITGAEQPDEEKEARDAIASAKEVDEEW